MRILSMTTTTATKWKLVHKCPKGHRYFTKDGGRDLYIADDSGVNPDMTDDGPLRVDTSKPIRAIKDHFLVPVVAERRNEASSTMAYPSEAMWLAEACSMPIVTEEAKYRIALW